MGGREPVGERQVSVANAHKPSAAYLLPQLSKVAALRLQFDGGQQVGPNVTRHLGGGENAVHQSLAFGG